MLGEGLGIARRHLIEKIITDNWAIKPEEKHYTYNELLFIIQEMMEEEGKNYLTNISPLQGFRAFRDFIELLLYRNLANYDSMILITAVKGGGKSSAALMMARYWCRLLGRQFSPEKFIAYNNADLSNKMDTCNKFDPLIADESIRFASAADWAKKSNKELKKKLGQIRTKHLLYILCFPLKIYKMESSYLQSYVNYWIDLYDRGVGAVFIRDANPVKDAWSLKEFEKLSSYTEFTKASKIQEILKKHSNFWQIIKFPKPPDYLYNRYLAVREKNVYDDENVLASVSKEDIYRGLLILALRDIMTSDTTLTMNRIILHIKNQYDINLNKNIIQMLIEDSKQMVAKMRQEIIEGRFNDDGLENKNDI